MIELSKCFTRMKLILTLGCNAHCSHCWINAGPDKMGVQLAPDEVKLAVHSAKQHGIVSLELSGGESTLVPSLLDLALREARDAGIPAAVETNALWATSPDAARRKLRHWRNLGLHILRSSYDSYHSEFVPAERVVNASQQASDLGYDVTIVALSELVEKDLVMLARQHFSPGAQPFACLAQVVHRNLEAIGASKRFVPEGQFWIPAAIGRGLTLGDSELNFPPGVVMRVECPLFKTHRPVVTVMPGQLVSFGCEFAHPRLTYRYELEEGWLSRLVERWENDPCIMALWSHGLNELCTDFKFISGQPCEYCFELLPRLFPDHECIDIRESGESTVDQLIELARAALESHGDGLPIRPEAEEGAAGLERCQ